MSQDEPEADDGPLHTLGLLEQLREDCKALRRASSDAYFRVDGLLRQLANPNLHDIPRSLPFRIELWDRSSQHVRWVPRLRPPSRSRMPRSMRPSRTIRSAVHASEWKLVIRETLEGEL
jgi:hypothetical protein